MLNRRHLRVKVLEALYAYHQNDGKDIASNEKLLIGQVHKVYELYLYLLSLPIEVVSFASRDAADRAARHIQTVEDGIPALRITQNALILLMQEHPQLKKAMKAYKILHDDDQDTVRALFKEFRNTPEFGIYSNQEAHSFGEDQEIIQLLFKKIICRSPLIEQLMEERNISWPVDRDVIEGMVNKTFKTAALPGGIQLLELTSNWEEDEDYIRRLFRLTLENEKVYESLIADKTENWEVDRIALMDTLLMKMALCEMMNFPSIPVKVSINEYIDISKEFSTPKSKTFINGILDKILIDIKGSGSLNKTGRGLLE